MKIETEFDLYCWIKHYFYRENSFREKYKDSGWFEKWQSPLVALQNADMSCGKFAEILAGELWEKGFIEPTLGEGEEHF